jgi:hypothetical protein
MELTVAVLGHERADQFLVTLPTMDPRMKATHPLALGAVPQLMPLSNG